MNTEMHRSPVSLSFKGKHDLLSSSREKDLPAIQYSTCIQTRSLHGLRIQFCFCLLLMNFPKLSIWHNFKTVFPGTLQSSIREHTFAALRIRTSNVAWDCGTAFCLYLTGIMRFLENKEYGNELVKSTVNETLTPSTSHSICWTIDISFL